MPIKSISTIQAKQVLDATHFLLVGLTPVLIFDIEGEVSSTTGTAYYIQLLGTATPTSGTTIPLYSRLAVPAATSTGVNGFSFIYRPIGLDTSTLNNPVGGTNSTDGSNTLPVYVAISSTDGVYTSVAASTEVSVNFEDTYLEIPNQVITGDTSTTTSVNVVFSDPNPAKKLLQFQITNNAAGTMYIMLFGYSSFVLGSLPLQQWPITSGQTLIKRFGAGWAIQQCDSQYILHTGCYLIISTTTQYYTPVSIDASYMKAWSI